MITRLRVSGFKNLVDVDVRLGPVTCIFGENGIGKSNLFDAIRLLASLADRPLQEAAMTVRGSQSATQIDNLFLPPQEGGRPDIKLDVEMLVPPQGRDDLNQPAQASITFLKYGLTLAYVDGDDGYGPGLRIEREELSHFNKGDARQNLPFEHRPAWRDSVVIGRGRRGAAFISTEPTPDGQVVKLHQEGNSGRPRSHLAHQLPRTLLSSANATECPTALLARREMQSWQLLQLEPSAMRRPDDLNAPARLGMDGAHLPATLYRLARSAPDDGSLVFESNREAAVYAQVANRLAELIPDVQGLRVDLDRRRELLTLQVSNGTCREYAAQSLSDGTLRFLALAILEQNRESCGVLCLEEPENGMHPDRLPAVLRLLHAIAVDPEEPVGPDNPFRQVIVNTHSPAVVQEFPDGEILGAQRSRAFLGERAVDAVEFLPLPGTWGEEAGGRSIALGSVLPYLPRLRQQALTAATRPRRLIDRPDLQPVLPGMPEGADA